MQRYPVEPSPLGEYSPRGLGSYRYPKGRYQADQGIDPVTLIEPELAARWGEPAQRRTIRWPLALRWGRGP